MMIEDSQVIRDIPFRNFFNIDPYYPFIDHGRNYASERTKDGRVFDVKRTKQDTSREVIIPILVEGRDFPIASHHIDLTHEFNEDNVNNNGLHNRSRNRRRNQVQTSHTGSGKSDHSGTSSYPVSSAARSSNGRLSGGVSQTVAGQTRSSDLSDDIIDLCMYEDMFDSDVSISDSCEEKSHSCSNSKTFATKSDSTLVALASQSQEQASAKSITPTPGYPVYRFLKSQLARDGRLIDYIRGDGNCFFRALSKDIYGSEEFHEDVRQAVVDLQEKYSKEFEQFLDSGTSVSDHITNMRKASTWASSAEIYAAATLLQRDIYVLSPDHTGEAYHWMLFKPRFIYTRDTSYHPCFITLCHTHGNHYDRITPEHGACNCDYEPPVLSGVQAYVDLTN